MLKAKLDASVRRGRDTPYPVPAELLVGLLGSVDRVGCIRRTRDAHFRAR